MMHGLNLARAIAHTLLLQALLLGLGVASLAWNLAAALLLRVLPVGRGQALGRAAISRSYRVFWSVAQSVGMMQIDSQALQSLRNEPGGLIIAANHPSTLDAMLIVAYLPRSVCIMKASLLRNIFLGAGARLARYISNQSARGMIRSRNFMVFLECRSDGETLPQIRRTNARCCRSPYHGVTP